jgi:serine phosphatase RsbU (regulator of sigma subunit)
MVPRAIKHRREESDESVKLSRTILRQVLEQKQAILSADAASDERFQASESISALTIRSMMCVPMLGLEGEPFGVINVDTQNPVAQFRKDDLDILIAVAGQAAMSYQSARLLQSHIDKQKQDAEMGIARNVQRALLPETMPVIPGYEFFAAYDAAQAVGGDYYDVIPLADGRICLAFGDVAGKGVPASLVMSRLSSAVRNTVEFVADPAEAISRINNHMCAKAVEGRFVTFILVMLDTKKHSLAIVNGGHMAPLVRHADGSVEDLGEDAVGVPIGVVEGFPFQSVERALKPGDTVVIYTDGVSEAMNPASDLYGVSTLRAFVARTGGGPAQVGPAIREDVKRHAAGRPQNDDITLMVFGRKSG